jgi:hypothetical protein
VAFAPAHQFPLNASEIFAAGTSAMKSTLAASSAVILP